MFAQSTAFDALNTVGQQYCNMITEVPKVEKQTEGCTPLSCGRLMHHILGRILGQPGDGADLEHLAVAT